MNRIRYFNDYEMQKLLKNSKIKGIRNKSQLIYKDEFKLWAVLEKLKHPEKTAREIFESANFDMNIINERTPQKRLSSWMQRYKKFGTSYFIPTNNYRYKSNSQNTNTCVEKSQDRLDDLINVIEKNNLLVSKLIIIDEKLLNKLI